MLRKMITGSRAVSVVHCFSACSSSRFWGSILYDGSLKAGTCNCSITPIHSTMHVRGGGGTHAPRDFMALD